MAGMIFPAKCVIIIIIIKSDFRTKYFHQYFRRRENKQTVFKFV